MLKLNTSSPGAITLQHLLGQQAIIDVLLPDQRAKRAQALWDSKSSAKSGEAAFTEVKETLIGMCVSTELCNYCEQSEATDIEHIHPKSFFPERTFQWPNYLLACKTCNTHYKLDQFAVFTPAQSATAVPLQRGQPSPSLDAAFIDPRVEDPMQYLFLDIRGKSFQLILHPSLQVSPPSLTNLRAIAKAEATLEVLQIGKRAALARARKNAFLFYQDQLERYQKVRDATTWSDLEQLAQDPCLVDRTNTFEAEQQEMMAGLKQNITEHSHPTVWREMQRQHQHLLKTKQLFEDVPDALNWE
jgi:uncharacterized protein (TIGR02646 family)